MKKRKNVEQEYLNPYDDSRVFDDGTLVSYSLERRAWVISKDGFELLLRDTVLPQPEEVMVNLLERQLGHDPGGLRVLRPTQTARDTNSVLAKIFPNRSVKFYKKVRDFLSEALIGIVESPKGPKPAYDLAHISALVADVEPSQEKASALVAALVSGFSAGGVAFFLSIPPTKFDEEEDEFEAL